ncbi:MAG: hypothetical protein KDK97_09645 [Verrucomicrobiales bacterium]|nr:hypothetical protein [Verrucomicrobiales bacterium]MCP5560003.1 hypothetical protein [Verrucomicrobiaceae bacterium]
MNPAFQSSVVLRTIARRYRASQVGRTGAATGDFVVDYRELIKSAQATDGEALETARKDLRDAHRVSGGLLVLETHSRDTSLFLRVRLALEGGESWLFGAIGESSPTQERALLAKVFTIAADHCVPEAWAERWRGYCEDLATRCEKGGPITPFDRGDLSGNAELLQILERLLGWSGESMVRFASCVVCGDSKRLEQLQPKLESCLAQLHGVAQMTFEDIGLLEKPRSVLVHGPMLLKLPRGELNLGLLRGPVALSEIDIDAAEIIIDPTVRVLTVENETTFLELTKLGSGTLLIHTSFPGRAVRALLAKLPTDLECWHFGDTDPAGYDILRSLRAATGRAIGALHMRFRSDEQGLELGNQDVRTLTRLIGDPLLHDVQQDLLAMQSAGNKGAFEQESLGLPALDWPFYG